MMGGFTQSESSTSRCGNSVVVGFNDSGSVSETTLFGSGGLSFSGSAFSTNRGLSFRDIGFVNPGPNPLNLLGGDPVVSCSDSKTFYYTQIFRTGTVSPLELISAVAFSRSTDSGASWSDPSPFVPISVRYFQQLGLESGAKRQWIMIDGQTRASRDRK
jgi:hypothetical protein